MPAKNAQNKKCPWRGEDAKSNSYDAKPPNSEIPENKPEDTEVAEVAVSSEDSGNSGGKPALPAQTVMGNYGRWRAPKLGIVGIASINSRRASDWCEGMGLIEAPPAGACVYFLLRNNSVVHVGQTSNIFGRIATHDLRKCFDSVRYFFVDDADAELIEAELICRLRPPLNRDIPIDRLLKLKSARGITTMPAPKRKPEPTTKACGYRCCRQSTGIHGGVTCGRGKLDEFGYWSVPCRPCAAAFDGDLPKIRETIREGMVKFGDTAEAIEQYMASAWLNTPAWPFADGGAE